VDGEGADCVTRVLYAELVEACGAGRDGLPLILTGHLHVAGGLESEGSERRIFVGGEHAVSPAVFPDIAAYVALGHLHREQAVERATIRYSGSPLPLSATEIPYVHGVSLVTLGDGRVDVEHIPIERPVPFLRLPERGEMRLDEVGDRLKALGLPADLPVERRPFVQVWLSREGLEGPAASWRVEVERVAEPFPVRLVGPPRLAPALERATESALGPLLRLADLRPEDLFCRAFAQKHGAEPGPEHIAVFHKVAAAEVEA
jgi:exonuclease SbcD